jgi:hypothetical protein
VLRLALRPGGWAGAVAWRCAGTGRSGAMSMGCGAASGSRSAGSPAASRRSPAPAGVAHVTRSRDGSGVRARGGSAAAVGSGDRADAGGAVGAGSAAGGVGGATYAGGSVGAASAAPDGALALARLPAARRGRRHGRRSLLGGFGRCPRWSGCVRSGMRLGGAGRLGCGGRWRFAAGPGADVSARIS